MALLYDTYYHIFNRGNNREKIFYTERNYQHFLNLYSKYITPVADLFAYCLLKNHFHLLLRIKSETEIAEKSTVNLNYLAEKSPSGHFSHFFNAYAKGINTERGRTGSLFQHPFGRIPITSDQQLWAVVAYIHQNPQKHHLVDDFRKWKHSSYHNIVSTQPSILEKSEVLEWFGGIDQYRLLHSEWVVDAKHKWSREYDHG